MRTAWFKQNESSKSRSTSKNRAGLGEGRETGRKLLSRRVSENGNNEVEQPAINSGDALVQQ